MTQRVKEYQRQARPRLLDELIAAGVDRNLIRVNLTDDGRAAIEALPEEGISDALWSRIDAAVAIHDAAEIDAATAKATTDAATTRSLVIATAQTVVGLDIRALNAAQVRSLMAILLYRAGGVAPDGKVLPLAQWGI